MIHVLLWENCIVGSVLGVMTARRCANHGDVKRGHDSLKQQINSWQDREQDVYRNDTFPNYVLLPDLLVCSISSSIKFSYHNSSGQNEMVPSENTKHHDVISPDQDSMLSYRSLLNDNQTIHLEFPKATNTIVSSLLLIESSCRSPLLAPILLCLFKDKPCDFCLSWADDYSLFIFSILPS